MPEANLRELTREFKQFIEENKKKRAYAIPPIKRASNHEEAVKEDKLLQSFYSEGSDLNNQQFEEIKRALLSRFGEHTNQPAVSLGRKGCEIVFTNGFAIKIAKTYTSLQDIEKNVDLTRRFQAEGQLGYLLSIDWTSEGVTPFYIVMKNAKGDTVLNRLKNKEASMQTAESLLDYIKDLYFKENHIRTENVNGQSLRAIKTYVEAMRRYVPQLPAERQALRTSDLDCLEKIFEKEVPVDEAVTFNLQDFSLSNLLFLDNESKYIAATDQGWNHDLREKWGDFKQDDIMPYLAPPFPSLGMLLEYLKFENRLDRQILPSAEESIKDHIVGLISTKRWDEHKIADSKDKPYWAHSTISEKELLLGQLYMSMLREVTHSADVYFKDNSELLIKRITS